jgi:hypothetical protein
MLLGLLIVPTGKLSRARREFRSLLLPGQRRLHTAKESAGRRRQMLSVIGQLDVGATVFTMRRPDGVRRAEIRRLVLEATAAEVARRGATVWVLDHQDAAQAARDRHTIEHALRRVGSAVVYDHQPGRDEPMLWVIDAIVWATGAGGDWARRVARFTRVRELTP